MGYNSDVSDMEMVTFRIYIYACIQNILLALLNM